MRPPHTTAVYLLSIVHLSIAFSTQIPFQTPHIHSTSITELRQTPNLTEALSTIPHLYETLFSTDPNSPTSSDLTLSTVLSSYLLVTASDMIPFVPCQPLAAALGAKLGFPAAFSIASLGQTTAGILAFSAARYASGFTFALDGDASERLNPEALAKFEEFQRMTSREETDDGTLLLGLVGLRLAPFFPFSAGNYLLGGATRVPLSLFVVATAFGCGLSNFVSTAVGAGGAEIIFSR